MWHSVFRYLTGQVQFPQSLPVPRSPYPKPVGAVARRSALGPHVRLISSMLLPRTSGWSRDNDSFILPRCPWCARMPGSRPRANHASEGHRTPTLGRLTWLGAGGDDDALMLWVAFDAEFAGEFVAWATLWVPDNSSPEGGRVSRPPHQSSGRSTRIAPDSRRRSAPPSRACAHDTRADRGADTTHRQRYGNVGNRVAGPTTTMTSLGAKRKLRERALATSGKGSLRPGPPGGPRSFDRFEAAPA